MFGVFLQPSHFSLQGYHKGAIFKKVGFGPLRGTKRVENGAHHIFLGLWGGFSTFFYLRIAFDNILKNVIFSHF